MKISFNPRIWLRNWLNAPTPEERRWKEAFSLNLARMAYPTVIHPDTGEAIHISKLRPDEVARLQLPEEILAEAQATVSAPSPASAPAQAQATAPVDQGASK